MSEAIESLLDIDAYLLAPESWGMDLDVYRAHCQFPGICEFLTHYFVFSGLGTPTAIGEAAFVRSLGPDLWVATVAEWTEIDRVTHQRKRRPLRRVDWRIVRGPDFKLVERESYRGRCLAPAE